MIVLMMLIPIGLTATAKRIIRVKSLALVDAYVFQWHFGENSKLLEYSPEHSDIDRWLAGYQVANLWLILIGGSIFNQLESFIDKPQSSVTLIAAAVPGTSSPTDAIDWIECCAVAHTGAATFFLNLLITQTFGGLFMELSRLVPTIVNWLLSKIFKDAST